MSERIRATTRTTRGVRLENVTAVNFRGRGICVVQAGHSVVRNVKAVGGSGVGISLDYFNDSFADELYAEDIRVEEPTVPADPTTHDVSSDEAAPFTISGRRSNFGRLHWKNCGWELKIQSCETDSEDLTFQSLNGYGSGVKFQGGLTTQRMQSFVRRVTVAAITVERASHRGGLYFYQAHEISIGTYIGQDNVIDHGDFESRAEVDLHTCDRIEIGTVTSRGAGYAAVYSGTRAARWHIGTLNCLNTGGDLNGVLVLHQRGQGTIDTLIHQESRPEGQPLLESLVFYRGRADSDRLSIGVLRTNCRVNRPIEPARLPDGVRQTNNPVFEAGADAKGVFEIGRAYFGQGSYAGSGRSQITLLGTGTTFVPNPNCAYWPTGGFFIRPRVTLQANNEQASHEVPVCGRPGAVGCVAAGIHDQA
jgi:hypothetical protein